MTLEIKILEMKILESNEFDRRVSLLINYRAIKDKDWLNQDVKKKTRFFLKLWEKMQKGMTHMISEILYIQLKEVLEEAK
jgi:hypothetical protein